MVDVSLRREQASEGDCASARAAYWLPRRLQYNLAAVEGATGLQFVGRDRYGNAQSLTLTGWTALAGIAALMVVLVWGAT